MKNHLPIGIFDSGLGGLTVLKALKTLLPNESFIYIGDTAHVPYGNKSKDAILRYSEQITKFLISNNVKLIVVACNTASSIVISELQSQFTIPIIDVITPLQTTLANYKHHGIKKIGVIGTYNTIKSKAYNKVLLNYNNKLIIISKECPLFVPIIEEGLQNHKIAHTACKEYLSGFNDAKIDCLVLGCTHYPIMAETIQKVLCKNIKIIDSAQTTAQYVHLFLNNESLSNMRTSISKTQIFVTDKALHFKKFAENILSNSNLDIIKITI